MRKIIDFSSNAPSFISYSAVGGYEERRGPLGEGFDFCDDSDRFGKRTWELAEAEIGRISLNISLNKAKLSPSDVDVIFAGDL